MSMKDDDLMKLVGNVHLRLVRRIEKIEKQMGEVMLLRDTLRKLIEKKPEILVTAKKQEHKSKREIDLQYHKELKDYEAGLKAKERQEKAIKKVREQKNKEQEDAYKEAMDFKFRSTKAHLGEWQKRAKKRAKFKRSEANG